MYLQQTMNAIGSCVQVIDSKFGDLLWDFMMDLYCGIELLRPSPVNPRIGVL